jgi:hypothetical protein
MIRCKGFSRSTTIIYPYIYGYVKRGSTCSHREAVKDIENAMHDKKKLAANFEFTVLDSQSNGLNFRNQLPPVLRGTNTGS